MLLRRLLALGPFVGLDVRHAVLRASGLADPVDALERPRGSTGWVVLFNVLSWTVWLASLPVAWMVADRVPIRDGRRALPLAFHVCASLVFAFIQSALNAVFKLGRAHAWRARQMLLGRPLASARF